MVSICSLITQKQSEVHIGAKGTAACQLLQKYTAFLDQLIPRLETNPFTTLQFITILSHCIF